MNASKKLSVLADEWHNCKRCGVHEMRPTENIFFGYGVTSPKYLIVGGTPTSADEAFNGMFAGEQGDLLFSILERAKINLEKECYFTYALSCRPKVIIPATETEEERLETREPFKEEYLACRPRLYEILYQTDPRAIITLGEVAAKAVFRGRMKFLDIVGKQFKAMIPRASNEDHHAKKTQGKGRWFDVNYPIFIAHDMNTIINNPSTASHGPLQVTINTIERARGYTEFVLQSEGDTMKKE